MNILGVEIEIPFAVDVHTTEDALTVDLSDGRTISVPLGWYPRLEHANSALLLSRKGYKNHEGIICHNG